MTETPTGGRKAFGDIAPGLADYTDTVLFGDVWERPGLSKRDRSLITVATLVALYRTNELPFHLQRAGKRRRPRGAGRADQAPRLLRGLAAGQHGRDDRAARVPGTGGLTGHRSPPDRTPPRPNPSRCPTVYIIRM